MKVIIAGTRDKDYKIPEDGRKVLRLLRPMMSQVVSGKATGADTEGENFAHWHCVDVKPFPVTDDEWERYGKPAGPMRNKRMVDYADALIAFPGGTGTANVTKQAKAAGLLVIEITPGKE